MPLKKLGWMYKPSPGIQINLAHLNDEGVTSKYYGLSLGYTELRPHADTMYYVVDKGAANGAGLGKAVFSPFKMIQVKGSLDFSFPVVQDKFFINAGGSVGILYGIRSMSFTDSFGGSDDSSEVVTWLSIAPRVSLSYMLSDRFSIEPFAAYNIIVQTGSTNSDSWDYNENTGLTNYYYSTGISINYHFQ